MFSKTSKHFNKKNSNIPIQNQHFLPPTDRPPPRRPAMCNASVARGSLPLVYYKINIFQQEIKIPDQQIRILIGNQDHSH